MLTCAYLCIRVHFSKVSYLKYRILHPCSRPTLRCDASASQQTDFTSCVSLFQSTYCFIFCFTFSRNVFSTPAPSVWSDHHTLQIHAARRTAAPLSDVLRMRMRPAFQLAGRRPPLSVRLKVARRGGPWCGMPEWPGSCDILRSAFAFSNFFKLRTAVVNTLL